MFNLPVQRFTVDLVLPEGGRLPAYLGSTLRGALLTSFRAAVCAQKRARCGECLLAQTCQYSLLFETPTRAVPGLMTRYQQAPHPYIIEPAAPKEDGRAVRYAPGSTLSFHLVLCGRGLQHLPWFVYALERLSQTGLGRDRYPVRLDRVRLGERILYQNGTLEGAAPVFPESLHLPETAERLSLQLHSPTRIVYQGRTQGRTLPFRALMANLTRRISLMCAYHGDGPLEADFAGLLTRAEQVELVEQDVRFYDWSRWSNRQERHVPQGGLVGRLVYQGDLKPFLPWLRLGEWLHVGKSAVMGMGHYTMEVER